MRLIRFVRKEETTKTNDIRVGMLLSEKDTQKNEPTVRTCVLWTKINRNGDTHTRERATISWGVLTTSISFSDRWSDGGVGREKFDWIYWCALLKFVVCCCLLLLFVVVGCCCCCCLLLVVVVCCCCCCLLLFVYCLLLFVVVCLLLFVVVCCCLLLLFNVVCCCCLLSEAEITHQVTF